MPFWLHFGSLGPQCWFNLGMIFAFIFLSLFRCDFSAILVPFPTPQTSILVLSPARRAIFPVFAMSRKLSKNVEIYPKKATKMSPKSFKNRSKNQSKIDSDFESILASKFSQNEAKMGRTILGKFHLGPLWAANGRPRGAQVTPKAPKTPPKSPK